MLSAMTRMFLVGSAVIAIASVPLYPGATLDTLEMRAVKARDASSTEKIYHSDDSYDKVMAFYRGKGGRELKSTAAGNTETAKMGEFMFGDSTVAINWPADVRDQSGKVRSRAGTRIAIGS